MVNAESSTADGVEALISLVRGVPAVRRVGRYSRRRKGRTIAGIEIRLGLPRPLHWVVVPLVRALKPQAAELVGQECGACVREGLGDYSVVVAPYVSPRSAEVLARCGTGFLDASGNCRLASGPLLIERAGNPNRLADKVEQRSLFTPGAERVLRAILDPANQGRSWTVRELASGARPGVSVGQAHKVAKRLLAETYLRHAEDGLVLEEPRNLLDAWVAGYRAGRSRASRWYSSLGPKELRERALALLSRKAGAAPLGALASFSAAEVLAPAVRQHRFFLYWLGDPRQLARTLELKPVASGENVVVSTPYDEGVLYPGRAEHGPVTCPLQTYLDLRAAPGRGGEAAQAVFDKYLKRAHRR